MLMLLVASLGLAIWSLARTARLREEFNSLERDIERLTAAVHDLTRPARRGTEASTAVAEVPAPAPQAPARTSPGQLTLTEPAGQPVIQSRPVPTSVAESAPTPASVALAMTASVKKDLQPDAASVAPSSLELEEQLGTNWLNKLGALMLVVGIAFFLTFQLRTLGPLGKDLVGLAVGAILLAGGIVAERRTQYRMFSRGVMAAGWGLLFFTTFAMHHVPAARVLDSQALDLALMLTVAGGMVAHALRYESEVVTALAFLFAFGTVAISHETAFTLSAGAILAIASATIAVRMRWVVLETGAIAGTYVNHFLWLPILARSSADVAAGRLFLSLAMLVVYWLTFRASFLLRRGMSDADETWSSMGAALNTAGLLVVASQHPLGYSTIFWALLVLGSVDVAFGQAVRSRRLAFVTLTTMAVALVAAAFPIRFDARTVSWAWFIEAEALVLIGVRSRDSLFTRLGVLGSALAGIHVFVTDVVPLLDARSRGAEMSAPVTAIVLLVASTIYYVNSLRILPRHGDAFSLDLERTLADKLSFLGAAALAGAAWALVPGAWLATVWAGTALALVIAARRLEAADLWLQAQVVSAVAGVRLAVVNVTDTAAFGPVDLRLVTVGLGGAAHHLMYRLSQAVRVEASDSVSLAHSWVGSAFLFTLAWYELEPLAVALVWSAASVLMFEAGLYFQRRDLRLQALAAMGLSFARLFVVNLNAGGGLLGPAAVTSAPLALLFFYIYDRLDRRKQDREWVWTPDLIAAFGTITLGAVVRVALTPPLVAPGWSALILVLSITAVSTGRVLFLRQATVGTAAVAVQAVAVNLYGASYFGPWWTTSTACVGAASVLLLAALPIARRLRGTGDAGTQTALHHANQVLFFVPFVLVVWLLARTMTGSFVTMSWGIEAVLAFMLALRLRERSFRLGALGLLLACVLRIVVVDVWQLDQQGRYLAFIALGSALLLVSFLYSKYRAQIEELL